MGFVKLFFERNKEIIVGLLVIPFLLVLFLGLIFGDGVREVPVGIVKNDRGFSIPLMGEVSVSGQLLKNIDKKVIKIVEVKNEEEGLELLKRGKINALVVFPENLTEELFLKMEDPTYQMKSKIKISFDKSRMISSSVIMSSFMKAFLGIAKQNLGGSPLPIDLGEILSFTDVSFGDFFIPGIVSLFMFLIVSVLSAFVFVQDKFALNLQKYNPTTVGLFYILFLSFVSFLSIVLVFSIAIPLFDMHLKPSIWIPALAFFVFSVASVSMGILPAAVSNDILSALRFPALVGVFGIFFGDVLLPMEAMPSWMRPIVYIFPQHYSAKIYRWSIIKDLGISDLWIEFTVLTAIAIVFFVLSLLFIKKNFESK